MKKMSQLTEDALRIVATLPEPFAGQDAFAGLVALAPERSKSDLVNRIASVMRQAEQRGWLVRAGLRDKSGGAGRHKLNLYRRTKKFPVFAERDAAIPPSPEPEAAPLEPYVPEPLTPLEQRWRDSGLGNFHRRIEED